MVSLNMALMQNTKTKQEYNTLCPLSEIHSAH